MARLTAMDLEDAIEDIFSLRVTSAIRVVGIRRNAVLYFLWWDRDHGVAKSTYRE